jgi:hypothetical protein
LALYLMCVCAMLVNAAICGALSGVFGRYQARVFWMVGLLSFCILSSRTGAALWETMPTTSPFGRIEGFRRASRKVPSPGVCSASLPADQEPVGRDAL